MDISKKIEKAKHCIKMCEESIQWYEECLQDSATKLDGDDEYYKQEIQWNKKLIKKYKSEIKEYKLIIE